MEKNFQGLTAKYQHINSHVKFEAVNEIGMRKVLLHHVKFHGGDHIDVVCEKNAFALALPVRLADHRESSFWLFLKVWDNWLSFFLSFFFGLR